MRGIGIGDTIEGAQERTALHEQAGTAALAAVGSAEGDARTRGVFTAREAHFRPCVEGGVRIGADETGRIDEQRAGSEQGRASRRHPKEPCSPQLRSLLPPPRPLVRTNHHRSYEAGGRIRKLTAAIRRGERAPPRRLLPPWPRVRDHRAGRASPGSRAWCAQPWRACCTGALSLCPSGTSSACSPRT